MKSQKGITLIALIITIIVLLILSLVTINSIFGNDSAMEKAKQARENNEKGEISDMLAIAVSNIKLKQAEENEQWSEYYGDEGKFKTAGSIENTYKIYGTEANGDEKWTEDKKYSYNAETGIVKLTIKKIGGTGIEYEYELNVTSGNIKLANSTQTNNSGSNNGSNGGSNNGDGQSSEEYTITYNLNDGAFQTGQTPITEYKTGDVVGFPSPVRDGYAFDGWYTSSTFESTTRALKTEESATGNLTIYAKWIAESKPYYFKYSNPDANGNVSITGLTNASEVAEGQVSGEDAYANDAEDIINLVIPRKNGTGDDAKTVTMTDSNAFRDRNKITKVCLHSEMTSIGAYSFWGCTELEELIMPVTIERKDRCFYNCAKLNKIIFTVGPGGDGEEKDRGTAYSPWNYSSANNLEVILEEGITKLGNNMFKGCTKLKNVRFPSTLKVLGNYVFDGCTGIEGNLDSIINLDSIGERAFQGCTGITGEVTIPTKMTGIPVGLFYGASKIEKVNIHSNVTVIGDYAFLGCAELKEVKMPITVDRKDRCFKDCVNINKVTLTVGSGEDGGEEKDRGTSYAPWIGTAGDVEVILEEGITKLGNNMFNGCTKLKNVRFPSTLKVLGNYVFDGCTGIEGNLDSIINLDSIGERAFQGCTGITGEVTIPTKMTGIPVGLFYGASKIEKVNIHSNVTVIGNYAFWGCVELKEVKMPITIERRDRCFNYCTKISKITLTVGPDGEEKDRGNWYSPWMASTDENLEVYISDGITKLGNNMFNGCTKLKTIRIPNSLRVLGNGTFDSCSGLVINDLSFVKNLTSIGNNAFYNCTGVTGTVELPTDTNLKTIQSLTFNNTGITKFIIPNNITTLGDYALGNSTTTSSTYYYRGTIDEWSSVIKRKGCNYTITEYEYSEN